MITKRAVDLLAGTPPGTVMRDSDIKGFQARRNANGTITYSFEYRAGSGRRAPVRRLALGKAGSLTPSEARAMAKAHAADVANGGDPADRRATARRTPSLSEFATEFLNAAARVATTSPEHAKLRPRSIANYRSLMKVHVCVSACKFDPLSGVIGVQY